MKFIIKLLIKILIALGLYGLVEDKWGDLFGTTVPSEDDTTVLDETTTLAE